MDKTEPANQLVPIGQLGSAMQRIASSYDIATREGRVATYNAIESECTDLSLKMGQAVDLAHVVQHLVTMTDEEGEETQAIRTVLILSDGTRLACVSGGVAQSISRIAALLGAPPWDPPMGVHVRSRRTSQKRVMYYLEVEGLATATPISTGIDDEPLPESTASKKNRKG